MTTTLIVDLILSVLCIIGIASSLSSMFVLGGGNSRNLFLACYYLATVESVKKFFSDKYAAISVGFNAWSFAAAIYFDLWISFTICTVFMVIAMVLGKHYAGVYKINPTFTKFYTVSSFSYGR